jgi:hypothetical protein
VRNKTVINYDIIEQINNLRERDHWEDQGVDGRIILR